MQISESSAVITNGASYLKTNPRLTHAAHEFEASLMGELLKPMQKVSGLSGEDEGEEGSGSALAGLATESLARVISERGGFGIADRVLRDLNHTAAASGAPDAASGTAPGIMEHA